MAKPTELLGWATDANFATGAETGLSTRLEPAAGVKAQGFIAAEEAPARWMNYIAGTASDWIDYLNGLPTDTDFVDEPFTWGGVHTFDGNATFNGVVTFTGFQHLSAGYVENDWGVFGETLYVNSAGVVDPATRVVNLNILNGDAYDRSRVTLFSDRVRFTNSTSWLVPVAVPRGCTITAVSFAIKNNSGGSANVLGYNLIKQAPDFATAAAPTTTTISTGLGTTPFTTGSVWIGGATGLSHVVDNSNGFYYLEILSDVVDLMGARVTFTDPGPRNG